MYMSNYVQREKERERESLNIASLYTGMAHQFRPVVLGRAFCCPVISVGCCGESSARTLVNPFDAPFGGL